MTIAIAFTRNCVQLRTRDLRNRLLRMILPDRSVRRFCREVDLHLGMSSQLVTLMQYRLVAH